MATSALKAGLPEPSITRPLRIIRSYSGVLLETEVSGVMLAKVSIKTIEILPVIHFLPRLECKRICIVNVSLSSSWDGASVRQQQSELKSLSLWRSMRLDEESFALRERSRSLSPAVNIISLAKYFS